MGFIDKVCGKIGLIDPEDINDKRDSRDEDDDFEESDEMERGESLASNVVNFQAAASNAAMNNVAAYKMKVVVIEPKSFDDAQQVANCLRDKRPVVINFENTVDEDAKRITDFISGTIYALNGEIKKVSNNVFFCAPSNVNISYSEDKKSVSAEMPWLKK
ncbi:cell division protein SepF [uncultured Selenomonas sp.]|jgi:cell division protein sepF 1|uniref:cell division protein SepF n=1 Tax=uncultured Selenomonas sp. TaxID=159275 RepID=UPI0028DC25C8|nr:cell division protein SepF [uncultured Selenomonas sp.]